MLQQPHTQAKLMYARRETQGPDYNDCNAKILQYIHTHYDCNTEKVQSIYTHYDRNAKNLQSIHTHYDRIQSIHTDYDSNAKNLQSIHTHYDSNAKNLQSIHTDYDSNTENLQSIHTDLNHWDYTKNRLSHRTTAVTSRVAHALHTCARAANSNYRSAKKCHNCCSITNRPRFPDFNHRQPHWILQHRSVVITH